ncbi:LmbE family N-acetylglucosaminyl deacetylase [Granulicella aggregans]|uniref:LmbE family N-acetylglucosaminyl deacetylase n=1 Tax=Granulicella aggregans TaxID=474949 RepID=A0A7W7ZDW7_9BACT|nr:PIG-L family deacetylase [Granulicella aggregans]MBB5057551.1 LmbE family N-acetylglucosaminyl deacetylase [Granulicella aggregans]
MTLRSFKVALAMFALCTPVVIAQQTPQFTDPANLRGERVKPRDGRELPIDQGARGLEQMLRKLNTRASLMLIVAHPDDEDGGMLTYYSRGLGARVAVLTLTRGEGGQNAMTGDFEDALGLLRTQELLSADRYMGVDQFFGTEVDFGFSKTKEEAFKKWTHERVLYDAVRSIRLYRPLVIAAVFIGGVTDGHGQHQVSGQIAQEAFKAAADPTVFPDMIAEGILPWQALKVYARVPMQSISDKGLFDYATGKYTAPRFENYVTGEVTTTVPSSDVVVHEGTTDPILSDDPAAPPRTYVQFARIGLGMQKSQIGGGVRVPPAGKFDIDYHLYGSALCSSPTHIKDCRPERSAQRAVEGPASPPEALGHNPSSASFFDGIDTSFAGLASLIPAESTDANGRAMRDQIEAIGEEVKQCRDWNVSNAKRKDIAALLADAINRNNLVISWLQTAKLAAAPRVTLLHEHRVKDVQLKEALLLALNVKFDAQIDGTQKGGDIIANSKIKVATSLTLPAPPHVEQNAAPKTTIRVVAAHLQNELQQDLATFSMPQSIYEDPGEHLSRPYFSRKGIEQPFYDLTEPNLRNAPQPPSALTAWATLRLEWSGESFDFEVGRVVHNGIEPVLIVPPTSLSLATRAQVLANSTSSVTIRAFLTPSTSPAVASTLTLPSGWTSTPVVSTTNSTTETLFTVEPAPSIREAAVIPAGIALPAGTITEGYRAIGYGDLPRTNYYTPATVRIVPVDLNLPATHRIGYLPGTGDAVPEALASINLKPDTLTIADLTPAKLAQYDTVILGVRTYAAHPDLHGAPTQALLDYARNGGNVLVQYQTTEFTAEDAPLPLSLGSNEKVVDETDPVQLLAPTAPFLTTPNKITPADFNNWVEERGHGFLSSWDSHYTALTETHDPDQDPQRGGLITTNIGKGRWTYCAFALYRQLPEAVPGAFRLFVNLIAPATAKN